ncbi:DUF4132 domain-containing protein [Pseudomonas purpurea]|uniref:DUF4132 domain-containing protein n=1 Tax=Pseudomonas purpurea TaxID=3136737 RepID=UPI00326655AD
MLKWIGKVLGQTADTSTVWMSRLQTRLTPLDALPEGRPGLAADMLAYVREGGSDRILEEVAQRDAVGSYLQVMGRHHCHASSEGPVLYHDMQGVAPEPLLRWARVLEASATNLYPRFRLFMADGSHWAEALLMHSAELRQDPVSGNAAMHQNISASLMEALLLQAGLPGSALLSACFGDNGDESFDDYGVHLITWLPEYSPWVTRHAETLCPLLLTGDVIGRLQVLSLMQRLDQSALASLAVELCELACSSSKQLRPVAEPLVLTCANGAIDPLLNIAQTAKPEQRGHALQLLWSLANRLEDDGVHARARAIALADKVTSVRGLPAQWDIARQQAREAAQARAECAVPVIEWSSTLTPVLTEALAQLWRDLNEAEAEEADDESAAPAYTPSLLTQLEQYLVSSSVICEQVDALPHDPDWAFLARALDDFVCTDDLTPVILFKVLAFFVALADPDGTLTQPAVDGFNVLHEISVRPTLLELAQMLKEAGLPTNGLLANCSTWWRALAVDWDAAAVGPYFSHHVEWLERAIALNEDHTDLFALFRAAVALPILPAQLIAQLYEAALGANTEARDDAQRALATLPDMQRYIVDALASAKADVKRQAAQWLGRLEYAPAIPALEWALKKEKSDAVRSTFLDTLETLGQPLEQYLDRDQWVADATKALAKGLPKDLAWFPWETLPPLYWADSAEQVPVEATHGMLVQAMKLKSAEPDALLRRFGVMFEARSREAFGQFVLQAWLDEDVRPISAEQATALAAAQAQRLQQHMQGYPQLYTDSPLSGKTPHELMARFLPRYTRQPQGTAIASKGLLAAVAVCASPYAAAPVARYLKTFCSTRTSQCKALIAMLAWSEQPSAIQLLLATARRFPTRGLQDEAIVHARALARRKQWTPAQLGDRTLPTAGFDEARMLELSYGERTFSARLLADFTVELLNPEGSVIAALPDPRPEDDAELAKASRQVFAAAAKAVATVVQQQTEMLYEAMCTGRGWTFADWSLYFQQHPIMGRLVQRLVWAQVEEGEVLATFRPVEEGRLIDAQGGSLTLPAEARVRLVHDSILSAQTVFDWQQQLLVRDIAPLFQQWGKGTYTVSEDNAGLTAIEDFQGHLIETFALRSRAVKLGYTRGESEEDGWFFTYEKHFTGLGLLADIRFTGNYLPETNRAAALLDLSFYQGGEVLPLSEVPGVLLSECYHDLRLIAAKGSGFDAQWRAKTDG